MTTSEFSNEFDIAYNSIATNSAPPIDAYEKSVFLTRAQLEIVNNYFNPRGNKYNKGFEQSSKRRNDLRELVKPYISTTQSSVLTSTDGVSDDSKFFRIPEDVFLILQEKIKVTDSDACINNTWIKVVPKTHDEVNRQLDNPFKKPSEKTAWRLDIYTAPGLESGLAYNVELISPYTITQYKFRYVAFPAPIILVNLLTEYPYESLTIDGITAQQTCALGEGIHREILNRAVELAAEAYNPATLQTKLEINKRNE